MRKITVKGVERPAFISINGKAIRQNIKSRKKQPVIRIAKSQSDAKPVYAKRVRIDGPSELLYSPTEGYLRCGARLVLIANMDDVVILK